MLFRFGGSHDSSGIHRSNKHSKLTTKSISTLYKKMSLLSVEMKEALLKGRLKHFGDLLDASWQLKKSINTRSSNEVVDKLYAIARECGALGGKVLGAGDAGYLLIYSSPKFHSTIQTSIKDLGASQESFDYTNNGLEVWTVSR